MDSAGNNAGCLLKAPLHAEAATTQVDNLVLMVNFSEDGDNTFSTNFNKYQEMYTGTASAPKRSLENIFQQYQMNRSR